MPIYVRTLYREFPRIKALGCCHEVFNTRKALATALEKARLAPEGAIKREDIKPAYSGSTIFHESTISYGRVLIFFHNYKQFVDTYAESGFRGAGAATTVTV
jgi:alpha-galactosidase